MQTLNWNELNEAERAAALRRPAQNNDANIRAAVAAIQEQVRTGGLDALLALTERFDGVRLASLAVASEAIDAACARVSDSLKSAMQTAKANIERFHRAQIPVEIDIETQAGVRCQQLTRPIASVGLYIPGGSAPLFSTVLMLAVPAKIAGCRRITLCSPPPIADEILYAARLCGIDSVYQIGGAQAVFALAYGSGGVPKAEKIFGPGNAYVTEAKRQVQQSGTAIDMPAGPSEVLIIADEAANPAFVAADLLSQAEHGADSQVMLVTPSRQLAAKSHKKPPRNSPPCRAPPPPGKRWHTAASSSPPTSRNASPSATPTRPNTSSYKPPSHARSCPIWTTPVPSSSAPTRPKAWATTPAAPTTSCPPTATAKPIPASASPTSANA